MVETPRETLPEALSSLHLRRLVLEHGPVTWYLLRGKHRQPWVIYGILRTVDAISPVPAQALLSSLIAFVCVYAFFIIVFLIFTFRIIRRGPAEAPAHAEASGSLKNAFRPHVLDSPARVVKRG